MDARTFFFFLGLLICLYQAYRGFMLQWILADRKIWKTNTRVVILLALADALFYFVCALVDWISLSFVNDTILLTSLPKVTELLSGFLVFIAVLLFLGITGITGQLPAIIQRMNLRLPGSTPS
jgi:hypothetical protein